MAPTHIDGWVLDLVLTDVEGVRVSAPTETSDHSAVFMDVVLEQLIPHLVCRQEVSISRTGWTGSWKRRCEGSQLEKKPIRSPCPVSSLNEEIVMCYYR